MASHIRLTGHRLQTTSAYLVQCFRQTAEAVLSNTNDIIIAAHSSVLSKFIVQYKYSVWIAIYGVSSQTS
jgi:hypothetical protein